MSDTTPAGDLDADQLSLAADAPPTPPAKARQARKRTDKKPRATASTARPAEPDASAPPATRRVGRPSKDDQLREKVADLYALVGTLVAIANADDAAAIVQRADNLADAWVKLANENPRVRRALERLLATSAIGAVVAAHAGLAIAIAQNHGVLPALPAAGSPDAAGAGPLGFDLSTLDPDAVADTLRDLQRTANGHE